MASLVAKDVPFVKRLLRESGAASVAPRKASRPVAEQKKSLKSARGSLQ